METIFLIGSGWAACSFLKYIDRKKYKVNVISPTPNFTYTPLLTHNLNQKYNLELNINKINNSVNYIQDKVIDVNSKNIITKKNSYNQFNHIIFAHGTDMNTFNIKGVKENCLFIKNNDDIINIQKRVDSLKNNSNIAVIGCGPTGTELIGNLIDNYKQFNIYGIDGLDGPIKMFSNDVQNKVKNIWNINNVNYRFNSFVKEIDENCITIKSDKNDKINYDLCIWCGGNKINLLSEKVNSYFNNKNRFGIVVDEYLKIKNSNNMYAIGDCAYTGNSLTAQVAYQQGKYLAERFNSNFSNNKKFNYVNFGQFCYIGNNESVYQNKNKFYHGKILYYIHTFAHIFNSINYKQSIEVIKGKLNI